MDIGGTHKWKRMHLKVETYVLASGNVSTVVVETYVLVSENVSTLRRGQILFSNKSTMVTIKSSAASLFIFVHNPRFKFSRGDFDEAREKRDFVFGVQRVPN